MSDLNDASDGSDAGPLLDALADSAIAEGQMKGVDVDGERVVIARVNGRLRAIGGICSHQTAYLEDGLLDGEMIRCPRHGAGFSLDTGEALHLPAEFPVPIYDVTERDGRIHVSRRPR